MRQKSKYVALTDKEKEEIRAWNRFEKRGGLKAGHKFEKPKKKAKPKKQKDYTMQRNVVASIEQDRHLRSIINSI